MKRLSVSWIISGLLHLLVVLLAAQWLTEKPAVVSTAVPLEVELSAAQPSNSRATEVTEPAAANSSQAGRDSVPLPRQMPAANDNSEQPVASGNGSAGTAAVDGQQAAAAVGDLSIVSNKPISGQAEPPPITQAPRIQKKVEPFYPAEARRTGLEGTVVLAVEVLATGQPDAISIVSSSGFTVLDQSAVQALRRWRFSPAKSGSIPVSCIIQIPIAFRIQ